MRILALIQGEYGRRIVENIQRHAPEWPLAVWNAPVLALDEAMDAPETFVPSNLAPADLILSLGQMPAVAVLLPELVQITGARAVIAPIDREEWLPSGLARQIAIWLADLDVTAVFPKPFCSLTEWTYNLHSHLRTYEDSLVTAFARRFGQPELRVQVGPDGKTIESVEVVRDSACGCARYVAERLTGEHVDDAEQRAGMLHHHFPCLASMRIDPDFNDTLMHISGDILRGQVREQVAPFRTPPVYLRPPGHVDATEAGGPS
ncbi:MAG: DUF166 family protein [Anaerolineae bacterium]|nr:hypothetical protein [Anaerolineae bacterium]MDW8099407.1 DUF166 family protein [Anaerolineae bacterium]